MKLSDINVDTKEFHVNRLKGCNSGPHELYNGESPAIKAWLIERAKMNPPEDCDTLFISERRKPLSRCTVWLMIGQVARAAGLEHLEIHPHMLRHSCGYALDNKGTDIGRSRPQSVTPNWTASGSQNCFEYDAARALRGWEQVSKRLREFEFPRALITRSRYHGFAQTHTFNRRWLEYLGLSLKDVQGWGWTAAIHPEDVASFLG